MKETLKRVEELRAELQAILEEYYGKFYWDNGKLYLTLDPPLEYIQIEVKKESDSNQG